MDTVMADEETLLKNISIRLSAHDVYMLDSKGYIKSWNSSVEQSPDFKPEIFLGKHVSIFYLPEDRETCSHEKNLKTAALKGYMEEEGYRTMYGQSFWASASLTALYDEIGNVTGYVKVISDRSQEKINNELFKNRAFYDPLTDLANRTLFEDRLNFLITRAKRTSEKLAILFLDLDYFKIINDSLGHKAGDQVLKEIAARLVASVSEEDIVARFGGDEFMILINEVNNSQDCAIVAEKVLSNLKEVLPIGSHKAYLSASMGIAIYPFDGSDADSLLRNADVALTKIKESGRNNYGFYSQTMSIKLSEKIGLESGLRDALLKKELELYFQPIVDGINQKVVAAEGLVRWSHPELGFLMPNDFLPILENSEVFMDFSDWAMREACIQNKKWQKAGMPPIRVAVNVSVKQFCHAQFVAKVREALFTSGLEAQYLELEITETAAMQNVDQNFEKLHELKKLGVHISIDDFGTGHSSLSYLKNFPIDTIKIDKSFVQESGAHPEDLAIIKAIITLAEGLKVAVVAEGVEREEQLHDLLKLNCQYFQGFLFGKAMPAETFFEKYRNNTLI